MTKGSQKGSSFERKLCVRLSEWWSNDRRADIFYRSHASGARATSRAKRGRKTANSYGDICALDPSGLPFLKFATVELKRGYNSHTLHDLMDRPKGAALQKWEQWIIQAEKDSKLAGSLGWMIINQRDRRDALVVMDGYLYNLLERPLEDARMEFCWTFNGRPCGIVTVLLEVFLGEVTPRQIKKLVEE